MMQPMSDLATAVLAIVAAALGLVGVLVGARVTRSAQHQQWLRDRKLQAVTEFVKDTSLLTDRLRRETPASPEVWNQWMHALQSGRTEVHLLCSRETRDEMERLVVLTRSIQGDDSREALQPVIDSLDAFIELVRKELHSQRSTG